MQVKRARRALKDRWAREAAKVRWASGASVGCLAHRVCPETRATTDHRDLPGMPDRRGLRALKVSLASKEPWDLRVHRARMASQECRANVELWAFPENRVNQDQSE